MSRRAPAAATSGAARRPGALLVALVLAASGAACAAPAGPPGSPLSQAQTPFQAALPDPAPGPETQATAGLVGAAVGQAGLQFSVETRAVRTAEPADVLAVPRTAYRVNLADPDGGYVVIYAFATPDAAATGARSLARYLAGGFGQTNYPIDAQFSVARVGGNVIFTWWSEARSSDPAAARRAFGAIASVGLPQPVTK